MNIFSVLDVSDNEEEVKVKPVKKATKDTKPEAPAKETKPANASKAKEGKPQQKQQAATPSGPAAVDPEEVTKENHRGRHLGKTNKHGDKQHGKEGDVKKSNHREKDHRSSNGKGKRPPRDGRGPYGPGSVKQEAEDAEKQRDAAVPEAAAGEEPESTEAPAKEEVVDTTMSYEEFLRKREEARSASSLLAPAKATRVVDVATQFAGLKTVEEGEQTYIAPKVVKDTTNVKKDQRSSGKSQIVDLSFKFESATNDYRRRDDNRGPRDNRKPRTPGAAKSKGPATVFNSGDFPSL